VEDICARLIEKWAGEESVNDPEMITAVFNRAWDHIVRVGINDMHDSVGEDWGEWFVRGTWGQS
jgi:hypothetical protein